MLNEIMNALTALVGESVQKAVPAVLILVVGLLIVRIVMTIVKKLLEKTKLEKAAHGLVKSVVRVVLYVLLGLIIADSLGIDVTSIVALASVLTLAVSLSVQKANYAMKMYQKAGFQVISDDAEEAIMKCDLYGRCPHGR